MSFNISEFEIGGNNPIALIAGPCQLESLDHARMMAERIAEACAPTGTNFVFKASFDKANRTSINTERGMGLKAGLEVLGRIRDDFGIPTITDVHLPDQCAIAAEACDILQIPAFLCRQTDLLVAAGETGRAVNIKKGQFLAPWDMQHVVEKARAAGSDNIMVCERGASFGYNNLVSDMRSIPVLRSTGCPVVFDATHSVQLPGGQGEKSGGQREMVPTLAKAAVAVGVQGLFMETHPNPDEALSDGPNSWPLGELRELLKVLKDIDGVIKSSAY